MYKELITNLIAFSIVAIAAHEIAKFMQKKTSFPLITGLIITGILAGNSLLNFLPSVSIKNLEFLTQLSLAIIAFSAGSELHLKELKSRIHSIKWMTISQLFITFFLSGILVFFLSDFIPFMKSLPVPHKITISALFGTIFVARSPSSAIAVINEMRARGPFTKTVMGVTVIKDVLVIILFAVTFAVSKNIINNEAVNAFFFIILFLEIGISFLLGYIFGKMLELLLKIPVHLNTKTILVLVIGYFIYFMSYRIEVTSFEMTEHKFILEPLLIGIIASFYVTNYTRFRNEFEEILNRVSPYIFIIFFTLIGASLSIQILISVFGLAILFFFIRVLTMFIAGIVGVKLANDPKEYTFVSWMPYLTQAGVAVGLATLIADAFPAWGKEFQTIIIAIIVINQILGPPLFKWVIKFVKESHLNAPNHANEDREYHALIFSLDSNGIELARQLQKHHWQVKIVTTIKDPDIKDIDTISIENYDIETISKIPMAIYDSILLLNPNDDINYKIGEWIYENVGTKNLLASANNANSIEKFNAINILTIQPRLAMLSLMDHMVRSRNAITLLLGLDKERDIVDIELKNEDLEGFLIRDVSIPSELSILSIRRKNNTIISHGYTMLKVGDVLTVAGDQQDIQKLINRFEKQ